MLEYFASENWNSGMRRSLHCFPYYVYIMNVIKSEISYFVFLPMFLFSIFNLDASPELLYWFSEQTLQPGPTVSLKCVATGNPPPQFTWKLDGFPVSFVLFSPSLSSPPLLCYMCSAFRKIIYRINACHISPFSCLVRTTRGHLQQ